jgi:hypothetical protein
MDLLIVAKSSLFKLAGLISDARIRAEEEARQTHARFNVFTTLLKESDEVRLHTRFLHCLLDPRGGHDCGDRFLTLFFKTLEDIKGLDHTGDGVCLELPTGDGQWRVTKEASRGHFGQLDLLLERPDFGIAIENKIYHHEGEKQLATYAQFLESAHPQRWRLIYLTLHGKPATTAEGYPYVRISYDEHILKWLESCLRATDQIIPIYQVILQYRAVVRSLTGKTLDAEHMKPIVQFVRQNPELIRYRKEMNAASNEAILQIWDEIQSGLKKRLEADFGIRQNSDAQTERFGVGRRSALVLSRKGSAEPLGGHFEVWVERDDESFGVGLVPQYETEIGGFSEEHLRNRAVLVARMLPEMKSANQPTPRFPLAWDDLMNGDFDKALGDFAEDSDAALDQMEKVIRDYVLRVENVLDYLQGDQ